MADKNDKLNIEDLTKTTSDEEVENEKKGLFGFGKKTDEDNEEHKSKKGKKNKKKPKSLVEARKRKKKSNFNFWAFFKKYLMYPLIAFILGIFVGSLFISSGSSNDEKKVYEIGNTVSLEDQIDNVRSSQIDAIRTQFSDLVDEGAITQEENKVAGINANAAKNLDPVIKTSLNTPLNPTDDEVTKREKQIEASASKDADSSKGEDSVDTEAIKTLITGNTPAKELNEPGIKSGATFASVMGVDKKNNNVYMTVTPFTTKTKTVNVIHIIKADSDGRFITGSYVGYINSNGFNRASDIYNFITNALKENKPLDNNNTSNLKNDGEKPNKEQQKQIDNIGKDDVKDNAKKDDKKQKEEKKENDKQQKDKK